MSWRWINWSESMTSTSSELSGVVGSVTATTVEAVPGRSSGEGDVDALPVYAKRLWVPVCSLVQCWLAPSVNLPQWRQHFARVLPPMMISSLAESWMEPRSGRVLFLMASMTVRLVASSKPCLAFHWFTTPVLMSRLMHPSWPLMTPLSPQSQKDLLPFEEDAVWSWTNLFSILRGNR